MRHHRIMTVAFAAGVMVFGGFRPAMADPGPADEGLKHGLGVAYSGSTIDFDIDRGGQGRGTFDGLGVFGKLGLTDHWALLASYRDLDDGGDLDPGEEISLRLADVHASYTWLVTQNSRWHVKAGLALLKFQSRLPPGGGIEDTATTPSVGTGVEWGGRRVRLFFDFAVAFPRVQLRPEGEESLVVGNTNTGLIFKF